ncbi:MAG: translocation/assembly module TamB, partial [Pseudomonadota bacterium]
MAAEARSRRRRAAFWLAIGAIGLIVLGGVLAAVVRYGPLTPAGRRFIEARATGLKVGRFGRLRIEGLAGDPWRAFSIARLSIADGNGVWLDARDVAIRWRWEGLFQRRVDLAMVAARNLSLLRRPILSPQEPPRPQPVSIDVEAARVRVEMTPAFSGRRGVYDLNAAFRVERSGAARGKVSAASLLHAGDFLTADFDIGRRGAFRVKADAREAQGGALAGAAGMAADQPFLLAVRADGSASAGRLFVAARVGGATPLEARGAWDGAGGSADGRIALSASSLLARYQAMVGPEASFHVDGRKAADGFYALALAARSQNIALDGRGEADFGRRATGPHGLAIDLRIAAPTRIVAVPKMGPARLKAGLGGDAGHWLVNGAVSVDRPSTGDFSLTRLAGPIRVEGRRGETAVSVSAAGDGGAGRGLVAALLGARPRGSADLTWFSDGRLLMRRLAVDGAGLKVVASGNRGLLGGLTFKGEATVSNLAAAHPGAR